MRAFAIVYVAIGLIVVVLSITCRSEAGPRNASTTIPRNLTDPFAFCSSVGTLDDPKDGHWLGESVPQEIKGKLATIISAPGGGSALLATIWRCDGGKVLACTIGANRNCGPAYTSREPRDTMVQWCADASHTDVPAPAAGTDTIYAWTCGDGAPVIVRQLWTADDRGFVKEFWYKIPP